MVVSGQEGGFEGVSEGEAGVGAESSSGGGKAPGRQRDGGFLDRLRK